MVGPSGYISIGRRRARGVACAVIASLLLGPQGVNAASLALVALGDHPFHFIPSHLNDNCPVAGGPITVSGAPSGFPAHSPALVGEPTFNSGSGTMTVWGLGWTSDNDQFIRVNSDGSISWVKGTGAQLTFLVGSLPSASVPTYIVPVNTFVTMTAVAVSSGSPTSLQERDPDGTTRLFSVFESTNVLRYAKLTDRNGNTITFSRDGQGRVTQATDIYGRAFAMSYNVAGFVASLSDSGGRTVNYSYDAQGHRVGESGPFGSTSYAYDSSNRMTRITYPNGGVKNYAFDVQNRVTMEDDGNGNDVLSYTYFPSSTTVVDALGRTTLYRFTSTHGLKMPTSVTGPSGGVVAFQLTLDTLLLTL